MKAGTVRGGVSLSHDPLRFSLTFPVIILLPFRNQNSLIFISKVVAIAPPSLWSLPSLFSFSFLSFLTSRYLVPQPLSRGHPPTHARTPQHTSVHGGWGFSGQWSVPSTTATPTPPSWTWCQVGCVSGRYLVPQPPPRHHRRAWCHGLISTKFKLFRHLITYSCRVFYYATFEPTFIKIR